MKNKLLSKAVLSLLLMLVFWTAKTQSTAFASNDLPTINETPEYYSTSDKNEHTVGGVETSISENEVGSKVIRRFMQTFKQDLDNVKWYRVENKMLLAVFNSSSMKTKALFAKDGSLIYHFSTGFESSLPKDLRGRIRVAYLDFIIGVVNEVYSDNKTAWIVNLEDNKNIVIISIMEGELEELARYKNAGKK